MGEQSTYSAASRSLTTRQAHEIASKVLAGESDLNLQLVGREHLWVSQNTIREVEGNISYNIQD